MNMISDMISDEIAKTMDHSVMWRILNRSDQHKPLAQPLLDVEYVGCIIQPEAFVANMPF